MSSHCLQITGFPYFPGVASGKLLIGSHGDLTQRIMLITQDDIPVLTSLPAAFIVVEAVPFSHTMIGLLGMGLPTVLISAQQAAVLEQDMLLIVDGSHGLITNDANEIHQFMELTQKLEAGKPVVMVDGESVDLCASVRQPLMASKALKIGAKAIGLVRSEFLLPENDIVPDEAFYSRAFREICKAASPLTVTFRLLDVAADKIPSWLPKFDTMGQALGMQGVRLYSGDQVKHVIEAQLAALTKLSNEYSLRVLVPFLVRLEEYDYWLAFIRERIPDNVPVGAMAETPAIVLDIGHLLGHADFVAIGCNDLMQSLYAADRDCSDLRYYLDPYAPLLYRLFRQVAEQAGEHLNSIQLCGVLAQIQGVLPVLLGLGYRTFSVDAPFIPYLANIVSSISKTDCEALASQVCTASTTEEVLEILQLTTDRHPPFLI